MTGLLNGTLYYFKVSDPNLIGESAKASISATPLGSASTPVNNQLTLIGLPQLTMEAVQSLIILFNFRYILHFQVMYSLLQVLLHQV